MPPLAAIESAGLTPGDLEGDTDASGKAAFLRELLRGLTNNGHRVLVFSQSIKMLDVVERAAREDGHALVRIDGRVPAEERHARVERFQASPDIPLALLTTQVGGLGLTLTAADRVVIYDPSWNPAADNQSVDRAYRIGQTRDVSRTSTWAKMPNSRPRATNSQTPPRTSKMAKLTPDKKTPGKQKDKTRHRANNRHLVH